LTYKLKSITGELKDKLLTNEMDVLFYNLSLKPIYVKMNDIIIQFKMDKSVVIVEVYLILFF
jgi:hypothetical protein